jgi:hypothetical protein
MFNRYELSAVDDDCVEIEFHHDAGSWVVRMRGDLAQRLASDLTAMLGQLAQDAWHADQQAGVGNA